MAISHAFVSGITLFSGVIKTNSFPLLIGILGIYAFFPYSLYAANSEQALTPVEFNKSNKKALDSLAYRSILFDYHSGRHFEAATQILAQKKDSDDGPMQRQTQQILLDLYLDIGITEKVEESLQNVSDIKGRHSQLRLSLAELYYQQSNMEAMFRILMSSGTHLTTTQIDKKNYLLGLYYFSQSNHAFTYKYLNKVSRSSPLYPYAHFNKAIALIEGKNLDSAKIELQKLLSFEAANEEAMVFRDRVALTLGELYLKNEQNQKARDAFREVRLNSPYAAPALLGLGWSQRAGKNTKAALSAWLELRNQHSSDPRFLHNLLLIPRQYETLGASKDALNAYNNARRIYTNELKEIEANRQIITSEHWLKNLPKNVSTSSVSSPLIRSDDLHKQLTASDFITKTGGANRLFSRYASKDFNHILQQYIQLQALGNYLSLWREQLPIYSEMIHDHQAKQETLHQRVNQTLDQLANVNSNEGIVAFKNTLPQFDDQWLALMTPEERHLLTSLDRIKNQLNKLSTASITSDQKANIHARIALLKGSLYWKISRDTPLRQEKLKRAIKQFAQEKQKLRENQQKILSAHRIMQRKLEPHRAGIQQLIQRIDKTQAEIKRINIKQKNRLQDIAVLALDKQQKQLSDFLAIAELSIARMHENAALKAGRR